MEEKEEQIKEPEFIPPKEEEKELSYEEDYEKNFHEENGVPNKLNFEDDIEEWGFD